MEQTKLTPSVTWLKVSECPFEGRIVRAETFKNKYGNVDARITIEKGHTQRTMDIYGENKNFLLAEIGDDVQKWLQYCVVVDVVDGKRRITGTYNA